MNRKLILLLLLPLALGLAGIAYAHGASIAYTIQMTVEIVATFDDGTPMAGGQVTIYAPDDPATPWQTGECDDEGRFTFTPDPAIPGTWDVQVRQSGHGDIVHIPIGEDMALTGNTGYSTGQIVLMAASIIWGFVGTALYFARRRADGKPNPAEGEA